MVDGPLLKGDRIVERASMCREMLTRMHKGHLGAEKSRTNMNSGIDQLVPSCDTRQEHHYKLTKEVLVSMELPWKKTERNIFHCQGKDHLLGIDYLSNDPETPGAVKSQ